MMNVVEVQYISDHDYYTYIVPGAEGMLDITTNIFKLCIEDKVFGYVGLMRECLLSSNLYLWMARTDVKPTMAEMKLIRRAAVKFLSAYNQTLYAEASLYSRTDNKFLQHLGFVPQAELTDRILYKWSQ